MISNVFPVYRSNLGRFGAVLGDSGTASGGDSGAWKLLLGRVFDVDSAELGGKGAVLGGDTIRLSRSSL
jgi:hypothetical protein